MTIMMAQRDLGTSVRTKKRARLTAISAEIGFMSLTTEKKHLAYKGSTFCR